LTPFSYQRPESLDAAAAALAAGGPGAKILAGGQSLLLALKERQTRPSGLISLASLAELRGTRIAADGSLEIGAATTYAALAKAVFPGWQQELAAVAGNLADRSVRNIGTIGGGVCQADPRYDMPVLLSAADASFSLVCAQGKRVLATDAFFNKAGGTHIAADEILTTITLPPLTRWSLLVFEKFRFRTFEAAVGTVGLAVAFDDAGKIGQARLSVGVVTKAPALATGAMQAMTGKAPAELRIDEIAVAASEEVLPLTSAVTMQQKYQSELTISLVKRALRRLITEGAGHE
jgi:carbon-monoxide dehydrogenase medium subunit